jgi:hypothetical protein
MGFLVRKEDKPGLINDVWLNNLALKIRLEKIDNCLLIYYYYIRKISLFSEFFV